MTNHVRLTSSSSGECLAHVVAAPWLLDRGRVPSILAERELQSMCD